MAFLDRFVPFIWRCGDPVSHRCRLYRCCGAPETPEEALVGASVDWDFARRVAGRVSNNDDFSSGFQYETLEVDLLELTTQAERLVESETGLISAAGPARARVTDRMGWVDASVTGHG